MYESWMKEHLYRLGPKSAMKIKKDQTLAAILRNELFFDVDKQMTEE